MEVPFAHPVERELARVFTRDRVGVRAPFLEQDDDGTVREACTPDFFLPELGLYVECTVMRQSLTHRKRRKVRKMRARTGEVVEILFRRDFDRLAKRWGLADLADAVDASD